MSFCMFDDQRMHLVVQLHAPGKSLMEDSLDFIIGFVAVENSQAREDPSRVRIDDEHGLCEGIQEDRVSGLPPHPPEGQEALP